MSTIYKYADSILSPFGVTTNQTWDAMMEGRCGIDRHDRFSDCVNSVWGAVIPEHFLSNRPDLSHFTKFEQMAVLAVQEAISQLNIDVSTPEVVFIMASAKGNIDLIDPEKPSIYASDRVFLWRSAQLIAAYFKNPNLPVVVSQACISGVSALLVGMELLQQSRYKYAVVFGADIFSRFTYAGFSSLYALAPERCQPFDSKRQGLNLGEAAACIVLGNTAPEEADYGVTLRYGVASNDAYHLSAPARSGEGLYRAIMSCLLHIGYLPDFVNAHGTATLYNDQMEAVALARSGLLPLPVTAFKGYLGHTLGAAGIIDVILSARCMEEGVLLPVMGFKELGVTEPICVQTTIKKRVLHSCLKITSGFGGNNAALVIER